MSYRCLPGDNLQMSYQNMSCRCLVEGVLQMSYRKIFYKRCLWDLLLSLSQILSQYLTFLSSIFLMNVFSLSNLVLKYYNTNCVFQTLPIFNPHSWSFKSCKIFKKIFWQFLHVTYFEGKKIIDRCSSLSVCSYHVTYAFQSEFTLYLAKF